MFEGEGNPNRIYLAPDLVEEIFHRLPLKSIIKFKALSKQWRSILESRNFAAKHMKVEKKPKILAAGDHSESSRLKGESKEIDVVYIDSTDVATRPSLTCDGLVCMPVPGWVNVLNPSTREFISFPSGPDPVTNRYDYVLQGKWWNIFPGYWAMGFGKDKVNGNYKVVRMFFEPTRYCEILDVHVGEWRKVNPPPYFVDARRKSVCANGSIYWLEFAESFSVLALDLHTEEFRDVRPPPISTASNQLVNLDDRLAIAVPLSMRGWKIEIWTIDALEKTWTMTYSIRLDHCGLTIPQLSKVLFRPVAVSKQGNLFFCDNDKRLFKYYPKRDTVSCLSTDVCVVSDFVENLVSLRPQPSAPDTSGYRSGFHYQDHVQVSQPMEKFGWIKKRIPNILITTTLVSAVVFRYLSVSCRSRN